MTSFILFAFHRQVDLPEYIVVLDLLGLIVADRCQEQSEQMAVCIAEETVADKGERSDALSSTLIWYAV